MSQSTGPIQSLQFNIHNFRTFPIDENQYLAVTHSYVSYSMPAVLTAPNWQLSRSVTISVSLQWDCERWFFVSVSLEQFLDRLANSGLMSQADV